MGIFLRSWAARVRQWHAMVLLGSGMVVGLAITHHWVGALAMAYVTWSCSRDLRLISRASDRDARMKQEDGGDE